jgi:hypothetical protein
MKKITEYREKWKYIYKEWIRLALHFKPINILHVVDETEEDKEESQRSHNNIRGQNWQFT